MSNSTAPEVIIADTVFINGKVATVDKDFSFRRAIAVKDGWIIDVGDNAEIRTYIGPDTNVIDLAGKVILPGAHDAHIHAISFTFNNTCCYLGPEAVSTVPEIRAKLAEEVKKFAPGEWVQGAGLTPEFVEGRNLTTAPLTCHDIDEVSPDNPVAIMHGSAHGLLANSKAMELCGITADTPDPPGGYISRDESGQPNGSFYEMSSIAMITGGIPQWSDDSIRGAILDVQKLLNSEGYTSYTDSTLGPANNTRECAAAGERAITAYKQLHEENKLTARVSMGFYSGKAGTQSFEMLKNDLDNFSFPKLTDPNWLELKLVKIFADGVHTSHTAWMKEDYIDEPGFRGRSSLGSPDASEEEQVSELHRMIELAHSRGFQIGVHAIGDYAVMAAIDGFIAAIRKHPQVFGCSFRELLPPGNPQRDAPGTTLVDEPHVLRRILPGNPRHYVVHADMLGDNEDFLRAAKYGVGVSAQPAFADFLFEPSIACVGKKGERVCGLREMQSLGVVAAGGSDAISGELVNWRKAVQSAVTRKSAITGRVYRPDLALTVEDAVRLFTINGAMQESKEHIRGSIEVGKVADFQVLDRDIFEVDPEEIGDIKVVMTMVSGKTVFTRA